MQAGFLVLVVAHLRVERKHGFIIVEYSIEENQILRIIRLVRVRAHAALKSNHRTTIDVGQPDLGQIKMVSLETFSLTSRTSSSSKSMVNFEN
jgi:hypothetical protein